MESYHLIYVAVIMGVRVEYTEGLYGNCWNGNVGDGGQYYGTLAHTVSGKICQPWASQSPHPHLYTSDAMFPHDTSVVLANNYCRDPDFNYRPWCYTMDPWTEWEDCEIPICRNIPCQHDSETGIVAPGVLAALPFVDANAGMNYVMTDKWYSIHCCGTLSTWTLFVAIPGTIHLQVWKRDYTTGEYVLKGENTFIYSAAQANAAYTESISQGDRISVQEGELIGWYSDFDMISYDVWGADGTMTLAIAKPSVGQSVNFGTTGVWNSRDYAFGAVVASNMAPYFTSPVTTVSITDTTAIGTPIYPLLYTDDDPEDIPSLKTYMLSTSFYFSHNTLLSLIEVQNILVAGTYTLKFMVVDHCGDTGVVTIIVTVTKEPVVITNLPAFANVSESENSEMWLFTPTFSSSGPHSCTISSYTPVRPEGNPFITKLTPTLDIAVYLKASAAVRYAVTTTYDVDLTCTDGITSDTKNMTINVGPNSPPVFENWIGSQTISAFQTRISEVIYTANISDAENDPLTAAMVSCLPVSCPFDINNDLEIFTTEDLYLHEVLSYDIVFSVDDGFTTVTSPPLTITINETNVKTVCTNLPVAPINVVEGVDVGAEVFKIMTYDPENDTATFTTVYGPPACASLFSVAIPDGSITTLSNIDFETVAPTTCVLDVTVNDGKHDSPQETLTIEIVGKDEEPVFTSPGYQIYTPEVPGGTLLPDAGILAVDPEGAVVSYSLNCGADSGYLTIDSATGRVTMSTGFNVDPLYSIDTINCTITASDLTGQSSTASLLVHVTDINDVTPTFTAATYSVKITNTHPFGVIGSAPAHDGDSTSPNNHLIYTVTGSPKFDVDGNGDIYLIGNVTGDTSLTLYTLTVTAIDQGTGNLASTAIFEVYVSEDVVVQTAVAQTTDGFPITSNVLLLTSSIALGTLVAIATGYLVYRFCCRTKPPFSVLTQDKDKKKKKKKTLSKESQTDFAEVVYGGNMLDINSKNLHEGRLFMRKRDVSKQPAFNRPISVDRDINISLKSLPPPPITKIDPMFMEKGPSESNEPNRPTSTDSGKNDSRTTSPISTIYNPLFVEKGLENTNPSVRSPPSSPSNDSSKSTPSKTTKPNFVTSIFTGSSRRIKPANPISKDSEAVLLPTSPTNDMNSKRMFEEKGPVKAADITESKRPASTKSIETVTNSNHQMPMFSEKNPVNLSNLNVTKLSTIGNIDRAMPLSNSSGGNATDSNITESSFINPSHSNDKDRRSSVTGLKQRAAFGERVLLKKNSEKANESMFNPKARRRSSVILNVAPGNTSIQPKLDDTAPKEPQKSTKLPVNDIQTRNISSMSLMMPPVGTRLKPESLKKRLRELSASKLKSKLLGHTVSDDIETGAQAKTSSDATHKPLFIEKGQQSISKSNDRSRHISNDSGLEMSPQITPVNTHYKSINSKPKDQNFIF